MKIEQEYAGGDSYLDKLCMELVGLDSSRRRGTCGNVTDQRTRDMLLTAGVPRVRADLSAATTG